MTMRIEWRTGASTLPEGATILVAFPGVANLGKVAVDSIGNLHVKEGKVIFATEPGGCCRQASGSDGGTA